MILLKQIPAIDMEATGENIRVLRNERHISVRELQAVLGFSTPQAIYKWERGVYMPSLDNLVILAAVFETTVDRILVYETHGAVRSA